MQAVCFLVAAILFAVKVFDGHIGDLDLIALGLFFVSAGLLLSGGAVTWVRERL